jgi:hypothetical protein
MKGALIINNVRLELGYEMLNQLAYNMEDNNGTRDIAHELAQSLCCETRFHIASRSCLNPETVAFLLPDTRIEVMRAMIDNEEFISQMALADLERFINTGDPEILSSIVKAMSDLTETYEVCERDWLCEKLCQHPDPAVRSELAGNDETPEFFLKKLAQDPDLDVSQAAKDTLEGLDWDDDDDIEF